MNDRCLLMAKLRIRNAGIWEVVLYEIRMLVETHALTSTHACMYICICIWILTELGVSERTWWHGAVQLQDKNWSKEHRKNLKRQWPYRRLFTRSSLMADSSAIKLNHNHPSTILHHHPSTIHHQGSNCPESAIYPVSLTINHLQTLAVHGQHSPMLGWPVINLNVSTISHISTSDHNYPNHYLSIIIIIHHLSPINRW